MARTTDDDILLRNVPEDGASVGNIALMRALGWEEDKYWRVRNRLLDEGILITGEGKGGSVRRAVQPVVPDAPSASSNEARNQLLEEPQQVEGEAQLYEPLKGVIEGEWAKCQRLDPSFF